MLQCARAQIRSTIVKNLPLGKGFADGNFYGSPYSPFHVRSPLMADTGAAATAASSAPAESSLVALTGAGSPWGTVRLRPARCLPSRRPLCHLLASGAL